MSKAIDKRGGAQIGWFGPWLREERRRRGISSNELAKHFPSKTGGKTGCVSNWELGFNLPTPDQFNTLCDALGLDFDRLEEAEREILESKPGSYGYQRDGERWTEDEQRVTAPATPEAEQWQGWGTAMAPSHEPIVVARKPLVGTVAENVQRFGTGAINVDAARIGTASDVPSVRATRASDYPQSYEGDGPGWGRSRGGKAGDEVDWSPTGGRWPKNTVLVHDPRCQQTGTKKVQTGTAVRKDGISDKGSFGVGGGGGGLRNRGPEPDATYADPDGTETVPAWECVPECVVGRLDEQAGERTSGTRQPGTYSSSGPNTYGKYDANNRAELLGSSGNASRFFPQFQAERARYVAKAGRRERDAGLGEEDGVQVRNLHPT